MAGRGPAPKDPEKRRRRNADRIPQTVVAGDGKVRGPDLPSTLPWPNRTREWWEVWRRSPQAAEFTATDWDFLLDTALLHAKFWTGNAAAVAAELRLRVAKFGATPEDRARLRLTIEEPAPDAAPGAARKSRYEHLRPA